MGEMKGNIFKGDLEGQAPHCPLADMPAYGLSKLGLQQFMDP